MALSDALIADSTARWRIGRNKHFGSIGRDNHRQYGKQAASDAKDSKPYGALIESGATTEDRTVPWRHGTRPSHTIGVVGGIEHDDR